MRKRVTKIACYVVVGLDDCIHLMIGQGQTDVCKWSNRKLMRLRQIKKLTSERKTTFIQPVLLLVMSATPERNHVPTL